jgi:hypothetical protein
MVSFNLGVWVRTRLIRAALMNEMVSIEIAGQKAARMIEATEAVACVEAPIPDTEVSHESDR